MSPILFASWQMEYNHNILILLHTSSINLFISGSSLTFFPHYYLRISTSLCTLDLLSG